MCVFNIKQSEMGFKRKSSIKRVYPVKRRKTSLRVKKTKKTYKKSSVGYKTKRTVNAPKKVGTSHWISYGAAQSFPKSKYVAGMKSSVSSHFITQSTGRLDAGTGIAPQTSADVSLAYNSTTIKNLKNYLFSNIRQDLMNTGSIGGLTGASLANFSLLYDMSIFLKSCKKTTTFTNQSNGNAFVDIYDLACRRDSSGSNEPTTVWTNGLTATSNTFNSSANVANGGINPEYIGSTPFMSQEFCRLWKVLKVTRLCLAGGETAEHVTNLYPNKKFNMLNTQSGTTEYFKGLSHATMMVVRGQPSDEASDGTIGLTTPQVVWTTSEAYATTSILGTGALNYQIANTIRGVDGKLMQIGSGAIVLESNA